MKMLLASAVCAIMLAVTAPASALLGLPETVEGTIENVTPNTLSISYDKGTSHQMLVIQINEETEFEETASLSSLQKGDKVKVQYKKEDGAKIAVSVARVTAG